MHAQVTLLSRIVNHHFSWLWIALVLVSFFFWMLGLRLLLLFLSRFKLGGHLMIFIVCISNQK